MATPIQKFLMDTVRPLKFGFQDLRPYIVCKDGFKVSVQASSTHYCIPRENGTQLYLNVEVGFPSQAEPSLKEYQDGPDGDVYGYVPVEVVDDIIKKHGGIAALDYSGRRSW